MGRPNAQPSMTSTQPATVAKAPWPPLAAWCAAWPAGLVAAEPTARVRPASTRPALTATPIPSLMRCPPPAGWTGFPSLTRAGIASGPVSAMNGSRPRNTQRQPNSLATSALIAGPASPGATQAVDSTAIIRARSRSGRLRPIAT